MAKEEKHEDQYERLITKLTGLFKGLETVVVDGAVSVAKKRVAAETAKERKKRLSVLFDTQIKTLKSRGCPRTILEAFGIRRDAVLFKAVEMVIPNNHIPFVMVIPRPYMGIYGLMHMVRNGDKKGYTTFLDPSEITDKVSAPKGPYFIYDVEDGKSMRRKSSEEAEIILVKKLKRSSLTVDEGIALCVHTNVLSEHYVNCISSYYKVADRRLFIYMCDSKPRLSWNDTDYSNDECGSASCRSRG